MRLLLDTHTLFWFLKDSPLLSVPAKEAADLPLRLLHYMRQLEFEPLPISIEHAWLAGSYPQAHRDPFDRLPAAQAEIDALKLVTNDIALPQFGIDVIW